MDQSGASQKFNLEIKGPDGTTVCLECTSLDTVWRVVKKSLSRFGLSGVYLLLGGAYVIPYQCQVGTLIRYLKELSLILLPVRNCIPALINNAQNEKAAWKAHLKQYREDEKRKRREGSEERISKKVMTVEGSSSRTSSGDPNASDRTSGLDITELQAREEEASIREQAEKQVEFPDKDVLVEAERYDCASIGGESVSPTSPTQSSLSSSPTDSVVSVPEAAPVTIPFFKVHVRKMDVAGQDPAVLNRWLKVKASTTVSDICLYLSLWLANESGKVMTFKRTPLPGWVAIGQLDLVERKTGNELGLILLEMEYYEHFAFVPQG